MYVTNRTLCKEDFLQRIEKLAIGKPDAIMLREKDLSLEDYETLAEKVLHICKIHGVSLIVNQNVTVAKKLFIPNIHLSMQNLRKYEGELLSFKQIGASIHSVDEAIEAEKLGATYLVAGHIYETNSKKNVSPRGITFLKEVCQSVRVPVFAIGGITKDKVNEVLQTGANGFCIMSEAMTCDHPTLLKDQFCR